MEPDVGLNDSFARDLLARAAEAPPKTPRVFYHRDGDCIEFLVSDEGFYGERIDKFVTVYHGRESGAIVGGLIKGVRRFLKEMADTCPGFEIELEGGRIRVEYIVTAGMWRQHHNVALRKYKKLREAAEQADMEVEIPALA
jgi:hypothetical protein